MQIDTISIGMTKAGWLAKLEEARAALDSSDPGRFDFTFYVASNEVGRDQIAVTFNDEDMVTGQEGRTDTEAYVDIS